MQARLHVVSVHSSIGTPHKPIVPTLAHTHGSHWGRSLMISIRVVVCLALLGCWGLEDVLPQSEVLQAPGVGCCIALVSCDHIAPVLLSDLHSHSR